MTENLDMSIEDWHDNPANWETFGDLPDDHGTMGF